MNKIINFFQRKGVIATIIGVVLAFPVNARLLYLFFKNVSLSYEQLTTAAVLNGIGMVWIILPSEIEIGGKLFTLKMKD